MGPKAKALEKQAVLQAERDAKAREEEERKAAAEWAVGSKDDAKLKAAEEKECVQTS